MKNLFKEILKDTATGIYSVAKITISVCLMICMFYGSYSYLSNVFEYSGIYDGSNFHNVPEDTMDIIVLGSSHAQYSYVPSFMYQDTGLYSYLLGSACQPMVVSYQMLKEALKTQNPELVLLEVYTATPLSDGCKGDSCYITAAYQMTGDEKYTTLNYLEKEKAETYYNTFINDHNEWKNMEDLSDFIPEEKNTGFSSDFGYIYNEFKEATNFWYPNQYLDESLPDVEIREADLEALNNILSLCKEKGIELMLFIVPSDSIDEEDQAYRFKVWEWADENEVKYQDYIANAQDIDFRLCVHGDGAHAFLNGAGLITSKLADFIKENYTFDSHEYNETVEQKMKANETGFMVEYMRQECNPTMYLRRLQNYDGTILIRYLARKQRVTSDIVEQIRQVTRTETFDGNSDYYAVVKNGEVLVESNEPISFVTESGQEFELNSEMIIHGDDVVDYYDPFSIVTYDIETNRHSINHIKSVNPEWWNNYMHYWERGYDMYYTSVE